MIKELVFTLGMAVSSFLGVNDGEQVIVERIEDNAVVIENENVLYDVGLDVFYEVMDGEFQEGDVLTYEEGYFTVDEDTTDERLDEVEELLQKLRDKQ